MKLEFTKTGNDRLGLTLSIGDSNFKVTLVGNSLNMSKINNILSN